MLLKLKVFDPGEVLYIYESPAGIGICVLRVIVSINTQNIDFLVQVSFFSFNAIFEN